MDRYRWSHFCTSVYLVSLTYEKLYSIEKIFPVIALMHETVHNRLCPFRRSFLSVQLSAKLLDETRYISFELYVNG